MPEPQTPARHSCNHDRIVGAKPPLKPKDIQAIPRATWKASSSCTATLETPIRARRESRAPSPIFAVTVPSVIDGANGIQFVSAAVACHRATGRCERVDEVRTGR